MKIQISFDTYHGFDVDTKYRPEDFKDLLGVNYVEVRTIEDFIYECGVANYDTFVVLNKDIDLGDIMQLHDWEEFANGSIEEELHRLYDERTSKEV